MPATTSAQTAVGSGGAAGAGATPNQAGSPVPRGNPENRVYRAKSIEVSDPLRDFLNKSRREAPTDSFFVPDQKKLALDLPNMVRDPYADEDDTFSLDDDKGPANLMEAAAEFNNRNNLRKEQLGDLGGDFYSRDIGKDLPFKSKDDFPEDEADPDSDWLEGRDDPSSQIDEINESLRRNQERQKNTDEESVLGRAERDQRENRVAPADNVIRPDGAPPPRRDDKSEAKRYDATDRSEGYGRFLSPDRSASSANAAAGNASTGISAARNADAFTSAGSGNAIADLVSKHTGPPSKSFFKPEVRPETNQKKFTLEFNQSEPKKSFANLNDVGRKFTLPRGGSVLNRPGRTFDSRSDDLKPQRSLLSVGETPLTAARKPDLRPSRRPVIERKKPTPEFKRKGFMNKPLESGFGGGFKRPSFGR